MTSYDKIKCAIKELHWSIARTEISGTYNQQQMCLMKTFANSLDPDQDRQNVGPDLDPNSSTL